jgi:hypothetical protein
MNRRVFLSAVTGGLLAAPLAAEAEPRLGRRSSSRQCALTVAIPLFVFALHVTLFGTWIDDDAGISFAYARNLAAGHGLVSQPGAARVEGYSNPLWVLLISALIRLGLFHVVWTPKLVAFFLTAGSFAIVTTALARAGFSSGVATAALTLVALQPSFVIWSASGLENPLYVFLLCLLMLGVAHFLTDSSPSWKAAFFAGLVVAGLAATRPDGAIFLALVPLTLLLRALTRRELRPWLALFIAHSTVAVTLVGAIVGFRWLYFNDVFPNTYYMKGGPTLASIGSTVWLLPDTVLKIRELAQNIAGAKGATWFLVLVFAGTTFLISVRHFHRILAVLALFSAFSCVVYLLLPEDWMGEYRFASPFFLFFYTYVVTLVWSLCELTMRTLAARRTFAIVLALLIAGTLIQVARRSVAFAHKPTVPLAVVAEGFGHRYNRVAAALGIEGASLLAPDMGGTLLYSKLAVFDLAGLCDRTIARTIGKDQRAFYDYVFVRLRPTFIHVHPGWTKLANLDGDERFRRDYVPIRESTTYEGSTRRLEAGDFIRRDVLRGPVEPLAAILAGEIEPLGNSSYIGWIR